MTEPIVESLRMKHLEFASSDDLIASVKQDAADAPSKPDPRDEEVWTFLFDWTDSRGKRHTGEFQNHILNFTELQEAAILKSRMCGGQPVESIDTSMLFLNGAVAHMMLSLKKRPDWAKDLRALKNVKLLMALWEKVDSHESTYFRLAEDA